MNIGGNKFKHKKTIAIADISPGVLKVAVAEEANGGWVITKLAKTVLNEKFVVGEIFIKENIRFDELVIVFPRNQVTVRNLELPATDPQEIRDIINIQAGKQTPFPAESLIYDYEIIDSGYQRYSKVLLAIAQKTMVSNYINSFVIKKDVISKIPLSSECVANWYPLFREKIKDETFAIICIDSDFSEFCVVSRGKLIFTRLLDLDIKGAPGDNWNGKLAEEIRMAITGYSEEAVGPAFDKVVFLNSGDFLEDSKAALQKGFSLQSYGPFEVTENVRFSKEALAFLEEEKKAGISFLRSIGFIVNPAKPFLDFSPKELKQERRRRAKRKEFIRQVSLIAAIAVVGFAMFFEGIYAKSLFLKKLNAQIARLEAQTSGLQEKSSKTDLIRSRLDAKNSVVEVLRGIYDITPSDVYFSAIIYNSEDGTVSLRGTSGSMSQVFKFVEVLKRSSLFREVKTKYVTKRKDLIDFEVICNLGG